MKGKSFSGTRTVTLCAMLCGVSVVILWLASVSPSGQLGLVAAAGLLPAAAVIQSGLRAGFLCYGAASILALVLLPSKGCALLYLLLFGHYPMVKSLIERLGNLAAELFCKLALFNALFALLWFGLGSLFFGSVGLPDLSLPILWAGGNVVFLIYDYGFSKLITAALRRFPRGY